MPAFDSIAHDYDRQFTRTPTGHLQRRVVWAFLMNTGALRPGMRVLELNCGTGEDALWLAAQGCRVTATDIAPQMVEEARKKAETAGLQHLIDTRVCSIQEAVRLEGPFDLVFSDFGGLNCLSPQEMQAFGAALPLVLAPGGRFFGVVMGRFCWWETLYFMAKGRWRQASRRWGGGPVQAPLGDGVFVDTWYYSPGEFARFFPAFTTQHTQPVGFFLPPSYLDPLMVRRPGLLRRLDALEHRNRASILAAASDHFIAGFVIP